MLPQEPDKNVIVTQNPSEIDQAQLLLVRFPNLGSDDVIIPRMVNLSFNIELSTTVDANRTLVSNIGRAIIKKLAVLMSSMAWVKRCFSEKSKNVNKLVVFEVLYP